MSDSSLDADKYGSTSGIRFKKPERKIVNRIMKRQRMDDLKELFCSGSNLVQVTPDLILQLRYIADVLESTITTRKLVARTNHSVAQKEKSVAQNKTKLNSLIMRGYSLKEAQQEALDDK